MLICVSYEFLSILSCRFLFPSKLLTSLSRARSFNSILQILGEGGGGGNGRECVCLSILSCRFLTRSLNYS